MKRVLITGANSYVGTNVEKWLMKEPDKFYVETLDMKNPNWKEFDFSSFDVVFHVAGIAHVSTKKSMKDLYFKVNRDLAIETAIKAKESGVKQFIFMSSMIIYGKENNIGNFKHINIKKYKPINDYGKSKLEADLFIQNLGDINFKITSIRSPVVYGDNCKGNYQLLEKLALKLALLPDIKNYRSMLNIDRLSLALRNIIFYQIVGVVYPQDEIYQSTFNIMVNSRIKYGKKVRKTKIFNFIIIILSYFFPIIKKAFGNKTYDFEVTDAQLFKEIEK